LDWNRRDMLREEGKGEESRTLLRRVTGGTMGLGGNEEDI